MPVNQIQAEQSDRQINEKDDPPMKIPDDEAASDRPKHRANQTGYRDKTHRTNEFRFGERSYHGKSPHGNHHGPSAPLQHPAGNKNVNVARNAAEKRTQGT